jgi:hypothetical protein
VIAEARTGNNSVNSALLGYTSLGNVLEETALKKERSGDDGTVTALRF